MSEAPTIGTVCLAVVDCEHKTVPEDPLGPAWSVGTAAMNDGRIVYDRAKRISLETYTAWTRRMRPSEGDLILAREAPVGPVARVPADRLVALGQRTVLLRPNPAKVDPKYLYYLLCGAPMQNLMRSLSEGATVPHLNVADVRNLALPEFHPLPEQHAIAEVLGALDDKIELNDRMNATLDEMARALFKSWFVNFDPVRAKAKGRQPSMMDAPTAALFPDSFEDSALGPIPAGWRVSDIESELTTVLGGTPSRVKAEFWGGDIPWINSGKVNEFRIVTPSEHITHEGLAKSAAKLLPRRTTVIAITGATLGQVGLTEISTAANQSVVGVVGSDLIPSEYVYLWVCARIGDLVAAQTGGAQQHVNKNDVGELPLLVPPQPIIAAYIVVARQLFDLIATNCFEKLTLAELRDLLLPKLISGEIRVGDVARKVEAVV